MLADGWHGSVKNTFIHLEPERSSARDEFYRERRVSSCPARLGGLPEVDDGECGNAIPRPPSRAGVETRDKGSSEAVDGLHARSRGQICDGDAAAGKSTVDMSADAAAGFGSAESIIGDSRKAGGLPKRGLKGSDEEAPNADPHPMGYTWPPPVPIVPIVHSKMAEALGIRQDHSDLGALHEGKAVFLCPKGTSQAIAVFPKSSSKASSTCSTACSKGSSKAKAARRRKLSSDRLHEQKDESVQDARFDHDQMRGQSGLGVSPNTGPWLWRLAALSFVAFACGAGALSLLLRGSTRRSPASKAGTSRQRDVSTWSEGSQFRPPASPAMAGHSGGNAGAGAQFSAAGDDSFAAAGEALGGPVPEEWWKVESTLGGERLWTRGKAPSFSSSVTSSGGLVTSIPTSVADHSTTAAAPIAALRDFGRSGSAADATAKSSQAAPGAPAAVTAATSLRLERVMLGIVNEVDKFKVLQAQLQAALWPHAPGTQQVLDEVARRERQLTKALLVLRARGTELEGDGTKVISEVEGQAYAARLEAFRAEYVSFVLEIEDYLLRHSQSAGSSLGSASIGAGFDGVGTQAPRSGVGAPAAASNGIMPSLGAGFGSDAAGGRLSDPITLVSPSLSATSQSSAAHGAGFPRRSDAAALGGIG
eukprot:TRINITY_DN80469_c0_g1_i1.p1 TRINITY_DN80469_c0_g1~~TRINITY_DN80469_c0_g1_i1.p1  ORF type:complete len:648 (-),score=96.81 TRINITY_DN80469_c0_g1_i1:16-1959(-)